MKWRRKVILKKRTIHKTHLPRGEGRGHSILLNKRIGLKYISNPTNSFCIYHYILASKKGCNMFTREAKVPLKGDVRSFSATEKTQ